MNNVRWLRMRGVGRVSAAPLARSRDTGGRAAIELAYHQGQPGKRVPGGNLLRARAVPARRNRRSRLTDFAHVRWIPERGRAMVLCCRRLTCISHWSPTTELTMAIHSKPFTAVLPEGVSAPLAYSPGVVVSPQARQLLVSGQVGIDAAGNVGGTFRQQAEIAGRNLLSVLAAAGMSAASVAKTTVFLTSAEHIATWRAVRSEILGDIRPASTLLLVSALVDPRLQVKVEAVAVDIPISREAP